MGGLGVVFRLSGADTQGSFTAVEHPLQPYTLASPIHTHTHEDEYSYILEGEVMVIIGDEVFTAYPGDWVCKPRGIPHAFWNAQSTLARVLEIIAPPGFEGYFDEMAEIAASQPLNFQQVAEVQKKYGITSDWASIAELSQKYHLQLEGSPPTKKD